MKSGSFPSSRCCVRIFIELEQRSRADQIRQENQHAPKVRLQDQRKRHRHA